VYLEYAERRGWDEFAAARQALGVAIGAGSVT
jgi:hypothetical protein